MVASFSLEEVQEILAVFVYRALHSPHDEVGSATADGLHAAAKCVEDMKGLNWAESMQAVAVLVAKEELDKGGLVGKLRMKKIIKNMSMFEGTELRKSK